MTTHFLVDSRVLCESTVHWPQDAVTLTPDDVDCPRCLQTGIPLHTLTGVVEPTTNQPTCVCGQPLSTCMEHTRALTDEERETIHQWFRDNPRDPS